MQPEIRAERGIQDVPVYDVSMDLQETMLRAIRELGDPEELVNREDLIVLKLEEAWTNGRLLPEEIELSDDEARLSMSQQSFVAYREFVGNLRCSAAAFAGCRQFWSLKAFLETAKYVLKSVRSLVLVHNRDDVIDIVTWFPTVTTVVLYHNMRADYESWLAPNAVTASSRLEQLLGTTPALGLDHLDLQKATLYSLLNKCPKLAVVMSPNLDDALSTMEVGTTVGSVRLPAAFRHKELFLGCTFIHHTGIPLVVTAKSAAAVEKAHRYFAEAEHLELTASSESAIGKVASYTSVTHLSLISAMLKDKCSFEPHVTEVLSVLRLVHLSLTHFCKVRLSVIANLCPHLKFLAVRVCDIDEDDDTGATFFNLEHLYIGSVMKEPSFFKLLWSCPGLRELELDKDELTTAFIAGPSSLCGEPFRLEHVERLTLRTFTEWYNECGLDSRTELVSELDATLRRLPSLRRVRTDNYKIRLRIASCFPNIALDWCTCTACFAEFPRIHSLQEKTYAVTQYLKLTKPIELVEVSVGRKSEESVETEEFIPERNLGANTESEKESMAKEGDAVLAALSSRAEDDAVSEGGDSERTTKTALESLMSENTCTTRGAFP